MRDFLLRFAEKATGKPRYRPDIKWCKEVWVSNIFRLHEYIFGRRFGIRPEAAFSSNYQDGNIFVGCEFYTLEAFLSHLEVVIRSWFRTIYQWMLNPQLAAIPRPVYLTTGLFGLLFSVKTSTRFLPLFGLAIATDNHVNSGDKNASPMTWSHTCTGSDLLLAILGGVATNNGTGSQPTITAASYNSVSATKARADQQASLLLESSIWLLGAPATGSNTVSMTVSNIIHGAGISLSYSGAQSGNSADAVNGANGTSAGSQSMTVTTVADNCWVVAVGLNQTAIGATMAANQTSRDVASINTTSPCALRGEDNNAAKTPAGGVTMGFTAGGSGELGWAMTGASFAPAGVSFTFQQLTNTQEIPREFFEKTEIVAY